MAESILKLKVDSQEYESKIKRAADGLVRYAEGCRKAGGTLTLVEKETIDFSIVRANFYKCGDDCEIQHYLAFSPVTTLPPGFHNPECFAIFKK